LAAKVVFVTGNESQGMYIDGKLAVSAAGRLYAREALAGLGIPYETIYPNENWLSHEAVLPGNLKDVII